MTPIELLELAVAEALAMDANAATVTLRCPDGSTWTYLPDGTVIGMSGGAADRQWAGVSAVAS